MLRYYFLVGAIAITLWQEVQNLEKEIANLASKFINKEQTQYFLAFYKVWLCENKNQVIFYVIPKHKKA